MKAGWQRKKLAEVLKIQNGYAFDSKRFNSSKGMPLVRIRSLKLGVENETWFDGPFDEKYVVKAGDLLIGMDGEFGCFEWKGDPSLLNQRVCRLQEFTRALIPKFLFYGVNDHLKAIENVTGFTTVKHLSSKQVLDIDFPIPPITEQHRIVAILDEAFDGIATAKANAEKNLQNARAVFESHLQSVFTARGEGWVEATIGSVCDIKHGFAFDGTDFSNDVPEGKPIVITPGNFTEDGKLLFNERNTKRFSGDTPAGFQFKVGDLVVVMTDLSSKMKILGKPAFIETDDVLHNQRIGRVVFSSDRVEKRLLYYFMMTSGFLKNIKISATGTMVKHTAPKRILSNSIPYPDNRKEQQAIVSKLDGLSEEVQRLESLYLQKLTVLDELKKSLLHQAFSGAL